jgi:hypothetical protein
MFCKGGGSLVNPLFPSGPLTAAMLLALTVVLTSCSDQPEPVGDAPGQAEAADCWRRWCVESRA